MNKSTRKRYRVVVNDTEEGAIILFLKGEITTREVGKVLGLSHQGAINFINNVCRQWFQDKKLRYKSK